MIGNGGVYLELFPAKGEAPPRATATAPGPSTPAVRHVAFLVDDLDAKLAEMGDDATITLGPLDMGDFIRACESPGSPTRKETSLSSTRATRTRRTRRRSIADLLADLRARAAAAARRDGRRRRRQLRPLLGGGDRRRAAALRRARRRCSPVATIPFDPVVNRSFHFWHMYVRGLRPGYHYAYRVHGPERRRATASTPRRCCSTRTRRATRTRSGSRCDACLPGDNLESSMRGVIVDGRGYDWEGDEPLRHGR